MTADQLAIIGAVMIAVLAVIGGFSLLWAEIDRRNTCEHEEEP